MKAQSLKRASAQTCSVQGISMMRGQVVHLHDIQRMIHANMREANSASSRSALMNNVLFGLQLVKATCDVVIGVASKLGPPPVQAIGTVYETALPAAELTGKAIGGQRITRADIARTANKSAETAINSRLGAANPMTKLVELKKIQADIVISATNGEAKNIAADFGEYVIFMTTWSLEAAGKAAQSKIIGAGVQVGKAGLAYANAYEDWQKNDLTDNFAAIQRSSQVQRTHITQRIASLQSSITSCERELMRVR